MEGPGAVTSQPPWALALGQSGVCVPHQYAGMTLRGVSPGPGTADALPTHSEPTRGDRTQRARRCAHGGFRRLAGAFEGRIVLMVAQEDAGLTANCVAPR